MFKQFFCKHLEYKENLACNCICTNCGRNLGFIGTVRKTNPEKKCLDYTAQVYEAQGWKHK
jgi:hypothetical protein